MIFGDKDTEKQYEEANAFQKTLMQVFDSFMFKYSQQCELIEWDKDINRATFGCPHISEDIAYQVRNEMNKYLIRYDNKPLCEIYDLKVGILFLNTGKSLLEYKNIH